MSEHLVALTPAEVPIAQTELISWCQHKIIELGKQLSNARQNLSIARDAGWRRSSWVSIVTKTRARMIYFAKIKQAVAAGYLVVPNFPVEVMAVRVDRAKPMPVTHGYANINLTDTGRGELLLPGEGRYVSDKVAVRDRSYQAPDRDNPQKTHRVPLYEAAEYEDPDFPVKLIKPMVLDATQRAMALRLFDRIGVVTGRKQDPVVVGQILDPRSTKYNVRLVSFFIAWWLNPDDL